MKHIIKRSLIVILSLLICVCSTLAIDLVKPTDAFYVADYADVLDENTEEYIINQNNSLFASNGAQICVVTVDFIGSNDIEDYAYALANSWGIGSSEYNNGILLLLVIGAEDYYCVQGSGLERSLSSGMIGNILHEYLEPDFAAGDYDSGVRKTFDELYARVNDIYNGTEPPKSSQEQEPEPSGHGGGFKLFILILAIVIIVIIASKISRGGGGGGTGDGNFRRRNNFFFIPMNIRTPRPPRNGDFNSGSFHSGGGFHSGGSFRSRGGSFHGGGGSFRGGGAGRH